LALGPQGDVRVSVVRVAHDPAVSGPAQRGPQPSSGPERHRSTSPARGNAHVSPSAGAEPPAPNALPTVETAPPPTPATSNPEPSPSPAPAAEPSSPAPPADLVPVVSPSVTLAPPLPEVTLTVPLPELPSLPLGG
jgi:hypothetical protein